MRCSAKTRKGGRCKANAMKNRVVCLFHGLDKKSVHYKDPTPYRTSRRKK